MNKNISKFLLFWTFSFFCVLSANAQKDKAENSEQAENRPLKITKRESPKYSVFENCIKKYGISFFKVIILVTFDKTGVVTDAQLFESSDCKELDDESLRLALKIKFKPAVKEGEPITVTKQIVNEGGIHK